MERRSRNTLIIIIIINNQVVMETTNPIYASELLKKVKPETMLEAVRVTVVNRLANHGEEWAQTFTKYNSGT